MHEHTDDGTIFRSRNSTSIMNLPGSRVSIAHTKSSLFFSCLSRIPAHRKTFGTRRRRRKIFWQGRTRPGWMSVLRFGDDGETTLMTKEAMGGCSLVRLETSGNSFTDSCLLFSTARYLLIMIKTKDRMIRFYTSDTASDINLRGKRKEIDSKK